MNQSIITPGAAASNGYDWMQFEISDFWQYPFRADLTANNFFKVDAFIYILNHPLNEINGTFLVNMKASYGLNLTGGSFSTVSLVDTAGSSKIFNQVSLILPFYFLSHIL